MNEDYVEDDRFQDDYNAWEEGQVYQDRELDDPYAYDYTSEIEEAE